MDCILTVDQGNSSAKLTVFRGNLPVECVVVDEGLADAALRLVEKWGVAGLAVSSVAATEEDAIVKLSRSVKGPTLILSHTTPMPIGIDYATPETLGMDRVAAAVGALTVCPEGGVVVADAGSALTIDVVDSMLIFRGGNISAGVGMRLRALNAYTQRLPLVKASGETPGFGHDTETALRTGAVRGAAAEIAAAAALARTTYGTQALILTGGDAPLLAPFIREITEIPLSVEPSLVALGLNTIFRHNNEAY